MCAHANALLAPCTRSATLLARATLLNTQEWQRRANKVTPWLWLVLLVSPFPSAAQWDKDTPTTNGGMFGVYSVADPSYSTGNGGFGNSTNYPQNGNFIVPMCSGQDTTAVCLG
jgi:hypothetical protein